MNLGTLKIIAFSALLVPALAAAQIAGPAGGGDNGRGGGGPTRPVSPNRGIDLSCMNPAQRVLHTVMVRVQLAGIMDDEISPTSRAIVIGMNHVMRLSLTPDQQKIIDAQVWRRPGSTLGPEWDGVKNSGSKVSALAKLTSQQTSAIQNIYLRCGVNWDSFRQAAGKNSSHWRRIGLMYAQQEGYLASVRDQLDAAQRKEWDYLVSTFNDKMRTATGQRP